MNKRHLIVLVLVVLTALLGMRFLQPRVTGFAVFQVSGQNSFNEGAYGNTSYNSSSGFVELSTENESLDMTGIHYCTALII